PVRVVVDRHLRIPPTSRLVAHAQQIPTWILVLSSARPERRGPLHEQQVDIIEIDAAEDGGIDFAAALAALGARGITRLLVEGGGQIAAALLRARLVDRLIWHHAPLVIGGDGIPALAAFGIEALADAPRFGRTSTETVGPDIASLFRVRE